MKSRDNNDLISVENAQEIIFSKFKKLQSIQKKLIDSNGFILDEEINALFDLPNKNNSAIYYLTDKKDLIKCVKTINDSGNIQFNEYIIEGGTKYNTLKLLNILSKD